MTPSPDTIALLALLAQLAELQKALVQARKEQHA